MPFSAAVLVVDRGGSETSQGCPPGECCGGGQQDWVGLSVHVYTLGRFMAPCHCPPTIFGKVRTVSLETVTVLCLKNFAILRKKLLIKHNMNQKTFGFYFFQKVNLSQN